MTRAPTFYLKWGALVLALIVGLGFLVPLVTSALVGRSARELVVERLEERFDDVRLERLDLQRASAWGFTPRLEAVGEGLSVSLPGHTDAPPFITMSKFTVEVGFIGLLRDPIRVESLKLDQLEIQIPPKQETEKDGDSGEDSPPAFVIEELEADGTTLRILPRDPAKEPLQFDLHQLRIDSAGLGKPMGFEAVLDNAKPPGKIQTSGTFGPLRLSDVGSSPLEGEYVFERAQLEDFGGIAGTLYSEGTFGGVLSRIDAEGFTETPDFQLTSAAHPLPLRTEFRATIDGTNGDTFLTPVDAVLGESPIEARGGVFGRPGTEGKTVCLDAAGSDGRIEDFLHLAMASEPPLMTGDIRFQSLILIPPGKVDVAEKLVLDGEFLIESVLFPEPKIQEKVDGLSEAGRGVKNAEEAVDALRNERVLSNMHGEFELSEGVMRLSVLSFSVPGATVSLTGSYGLVTKEIDFQGELRLDAKLSETATGFKSFLLKLIDPLLQRKDAGAVIPIKISGTPDEPSFGPDLSRVITREEVTTPVEADAFAFRKSIPKCEERLNVTPSRN